MYIFELIFKIIKDRKKKQVQKEPEEELYPNCEHIFLPVDSTKKVLACTKCGVIKKTE